MPLIEFELNADNSKVKRSIDDTVSYAEQAKARIRSEKGIEMRVEVGKLKNDLAAMNAEIKAAIKAGDIDRVLKLQVDKIGLQKELTVANRAFTNFVNTGSTETSSLGKLFESLGNKIGGPTGSVVSSLGSATTSFKSFFGAAMIGGGVAAIAAGMVKLGVSAIALGDKYEQASISFEVMLGSAEKARALLTDLANFSKNTPFELLDTRQTTKQLLAFGIEANKIIPTLKSLGDVAAGTGTGLERIGYAYGQVKTAGRLLGTELRQFTEAGVPILEELAKMYGVTTAAAREMITDGKVGFADVEQAFKNMSSEGGRFFNLMERQSKTLSGTVSNLKDSWNIFLEGLGAKLLPIGKGFVVMAKMVVDNIGAISVALTGLGAILAVVFGPAIIAFLGAFAVPIAIIAGLTAVFTGLAYVLGSMDPKLDTTGQKMTELGGKVDSLKEKVSNLKESLKDVGKELSLLDRKYEAGLIAVDEYTKEHDKLIGKQKSLQSELDSTKDSLGEAKDAYGEAREAIEKVEVQQAMLKFKLQQGMITNAQYKEGMTETSKALRILKGTTIEMINANGDLVEVSTSLIYAQDNVQDALGRLSSAKSVSEFNKLRNEILATKHELLEIQKLLAFNQTIDVLKLQENPLTDPKALQRAQDTLRKTQQVVAQTQAIITASQNATYANTRPVGGGGGGGKGSGKSASEKMADGVKEDMKKVDDAYEKSIKKVGEYASELETLEDKFDELKDNALADLREIADKLDEIDEKKSGNTADLNTNLSERRLEIMKQEEEIQLKIAEAKAEQDGYDDKRITLERELAILQQRQSEFTDKTAQSTKDALALSIQKKQAQIASANAGINPEVTQYEQELAELVKERQLIEANVTGDILAQAEATGLLSEAQKTLNKYKEEQSKLDAQAAELLQKKAVAEAVANERKIVVSADGSSVSVEDETGKMVEITEFKAKEYAIDSEAKRAKLEDDTKMYGDLLDAELKKLNDIDIEKRRVEGEFTKFFKGEIADRNASLQSYIEMAQKAAAAMRSLGLEKQAQQAEAAAGSSTSTSNKTVNITNNINTGTDATSVARTLNNKMI